MKEIIEELEKEYHALNDEFERQEIANDSFYLSYDYKYLDNKITALRNKIKKLKGHKDNG